MHYFLTACLYVCCGICKSFVLALLIQIPKKKPKASSVSKDVLIPARCYSSCACASGFLTNLMSHKLIQ